MSEIQVGQINSTDGSTAITTGADGYVSFAKTQIGGRRNLIINGAMQVAQRGTSTFTMSSTLEYGLVDRYKFQEVSGGAMTVDISTDVPTGFKNSIKFTVTSADTDGLDAADRCTMDHRIEGQNMTQLAQGTSNATGFTFSFWVKSSVTGTFGGAFANGSVNRSYPYTYTINSANTWEHKTISVDGDTTGTWATDNTNGMFVWFSLGVGSTRSGTAGSWQSADYRNATGTVNLIENAGATFYITGVQLEVGTVATPFEHRSYGEELALCERYYEVVRSNASGYAWLSVPYTSTANSQWVWHFKVEKRTDATIVSESSWQGTPTVEEVNRTAYRAGSNANFYPFQSPAGSVVISADAEL